MIFRGSDSKKEVSLLRKDRFKEIDNFILETEKIIKKSSLK